MDSLNTPIKRIDLIKMNAKDIAYLLTEYQRHMKEAKEIMATIEQLIYPEMLGPVTFEEFGPVSASNGPAGKTLASEGLTLEEELSEREFQKAKRRLCGEL